MVKFLLPRGGCARVRRRKSYRALTMSRRRRKVAHARRARRSIKILSKFDPVKFDEKSRRIRVDIGQKRRFIANDSFKPVC